MKPLSFYDQQHLQRVLIQQQNLATIFNGFIASVSPYLKLWTETGKMNVWIRNGSIENVIDRELIKLQSELANNISSFQLDAWKRSNMKNDDIIKSFIDGMSMRSLVKEGMFGQNFNALHQLQNRIENGMNLSQKVWKIAEQAKTQIEFFLSSGISIGRSANDISRDIRQLLNEPDKRFRRVRNESGKLVLSQPMKDYHPGTGVYRSAKMNALRLSATETNRAYRKADHERWKNMDFVLGFEVKRSGNNKGPCKICDQLVGRYPKEFEFTGWHSFCICLAIPILMEHEDFADYLLNDIIPEDNVIKDIPSKAFKFLTNNPQFLPSSYFVKDYKR